MRRFALFLFFLTAATSAEQRPALNARVFDRAWETVAERYWDPGFHGLDWDAMRERYRPRALAAQDSRALYAVLGEMLGKLGDSHVYAIDPRRAAEDKQDAEGVAHAAFGFSLWQEEGAWRVFAVRPGSPAARAGVLVGWELLTIDGAAPDPDRPPTAGTAATLAFRDDDGRARTLTLKSEMLAPEADWRARHLPGDMLLLTIDTFEGPADRWLRAQIADDPPAALILDLRENDGGEADVVGRVAGAFFAGKQTLLRRTDRKRERDVPVLGTGRNAYRGPIAVLVGRRSASGAEALAALVAETGRGITLGERTSGALTGAALEDLPDGGQLSIAVFDIRTPAGRRIEGTGFTPAQVIRPTLADLRAGRDPVLERAMALLKSETTR